MSTVGSGLQKYLLSLMCLLLPATSAAQSAGSINPVQIWSAWGGSLEFSTFQGVLDDADLVIASNQTDSGQASYAFSVQNLGSLEFYAPEGSFSHFIDGELTVQTDLQFISGVNVAQLQKLRIRGAESEGFPSLVIFDNDGNEIFTADFIQVQVESGDQALNLRNMDLKIGRDLADMLGKSFLDGQVFGQLNMELNLNIPAGAQTSTRGGVCDGRPHWSTNGFDVDVGIISMGNVSDFDSFTIDSQTFDVIAPGATLENLQDADGADVPWFTKFSGIFPPHNNDQHPYLVWNMYRITDNVIEAIGRSAVKHAFLTINSNCDFNCDGQVGIPNAGGHILWPGCQDVYGAGTNNSGRHLAPRFEVDPLTGIFVSPGSFFDPQGICTLDPPNCTGANQPNSSDGTGENRMNILRSDLQVPSADYFIEAWYVIRDDINIFNTMSSQQVVGTFNPGQGGGLWTFAESNFVVGPAIDRWVPPGTDPMTGSQNVTFADPETIGHFKIAIRTEDLGGGQFSYTYILANYDVTAGLSELNLNSSAGNVSNFSFNDPDQNASNDWTLAPGSELSFQAASGDEMPWGNAYTFTFVGGPPSPGQATIRIGDIGSATTVDVDILVPDLAEEFLLDGFESP